MPNASSLQELWNFPMERLKPIDQLLTPDPRYAAMILFGNEDTEATYTLEDHYHRFALLTIAGNAPEEVVGAFVAAQHLAIMSWFNFPLSSIAEVQAYFSLELALRRRMSGDRASGLSERIKYAATNSWIRPERLLTIDPCLTKDARTDFPDRPLAQDGNSLLEHLISQLPKDRNWLAHGNYSPGTDPFITLDLVSQLLKQLYPE